MRTDISTTIPITNVATATQVLMYPEYKAKYGPITSVPPNVYVMRQKYNTKTEILVPELSKSCHCISFINPDDDIILCPNCGESIHKLCFERDSSKACSKCKKEPVEAKAIVEEFKKRKGLIDFEENANT